MFRNVKFRTHLSAPDRPVLEVQLNSTIKDGVEIITVSRGTPKTKMPLPTEYTLSNLVEAKVPLNKVSSELDIAPNADQLNAISSYIDKQTKTDE